MNINYDRSKIKLAGIGMLPWTRLGPHRWFDDYAIVSYYGWDSDIEYPKNYSLYKKDSKTIQPFRTQTLLETDEFRSIAHGELEDHIFLTYKPVATPSGLEGRFVSNEPHFSNWENKAVIREKLGGLVTFPEFVIVELNDLNSKKKDIFKQLGPEMVVQHESLSGGRGTFFVRDESDYNLVSERLSEKTKSNDRVIISTLVHGRERSIQCVISKGEVLAGPLQQQIVRNSLLVNPDDDLSDQFCGGVVGVTEDESVEQEIQRVARTVGEQMEKEGYKGIFGIDFIVSDNNDVFMIEVNARTTGMLPLLNLSQKETPFYLIHILELMGAEYEVKASDEVANSPKSFVILHNKANKKVSFNSIKSGYYEIFQGDDLKFIKTGIDWSEKFSLLIQMDGLEHERKRGERLIQVFFKDNIINKGSQLTQQSEDVIRQLYARLEKS